MNTLSPTDAAKIARGVYRLRTDSVSAVRERGQTLGCEGMFTVDDSSRFQGRSGALAWKPLSGFGYIAAGEGQYQGEILVATRGTAMQVDWLSNINIAMQTGPSGHYVHAGFNEVWKSFATEIRKFLEGRNPAGIHCVGHSLGGALAGLNADYFSDMKVANVKLYTFGAPRAGIFTFSRALTRRIGSENIYRVSHPSDPVPMIPLFPFQHLPHSTGGYVISNAYSGLINANAHGMEPSYIPGVEGKAWRALATEQDEPGWGAKVQRWLEQAASGSSSFMKNSAKLLGMIARALAWLIKKAGDILVGAIGTVLAVGATVLDQLAYMLSRAARISQEMAGYVRGLINAIFAFTGHPSSHGETLTQGFLRWILVILYSSIFPIALQALLAAN